MNDVIYRLATPDDVPAIMEVRKQAWLASYANETYGIMPDDLAAKNYDGPDIKAEYCGKVESDDWRIWVAENDGQVVGCVFARKGDDHNEAENLYVLPGYQSQGIGSRLVEICMEWLGDDKDIEIGVVAYNFRPIEYYRRLGFVEMGEIIHEEGMLPTGKQIPGVKMVKRAKG
jgi:ribosomal protein S18 acetylase RimI-like enzyme